jgi:hypothetical protein
MSKSEDVLSGKLDACLADSVLKVSAGTTHIYQGHFLYILKTIYVTDAT